MGVQYILRHFYHKYAQIVVVGSDPKSMILDIEGHSIVQFRIELKEGLLRFIYRFHQRDCSEKSISILRQ